MPDSDSLAARWSNENASKECYFISPLEVMRNRYFVIHKNWLSRRNPQSVHSLSPFEL